MYIWPIKWAVERSATTGLDFSCQVPQNRKPVECLQTYNLTQTNIHTEPFDDLINVCWKCINALNGGYAVPCPRSVNPSRWCPHRWMQMEPSSEVDRKAPHKIHDALYAQCLTEPTTPEKHATKNQENQQSKKRHLMKEIIFSFSIICRQNPIYLNRKNIGI